MRFARRATLASAAVGIAIASALVVGTFALSVVVIHGVQVEVKGPTALPVGVTITPVFIAPTTRQGAIPPLPLDVAAGENLTVIWGIEIESGATTGVRYNVSLDSVSSPFEFSSQVFGFVWQGLQGDEQFTEEITVLAPQSAGSYNVEVVLSVTY